VPEGSAVHRQVVLIALALCGLVALARPAPAQAASPTLAVPYVSQLTPVSGLGRAVAAYACGPASAAMVARYFGAPTPLARAEALLGGTALVGDGSEPWQVAGAIRALAPGLAADAASAPGATAARSLLASELAQEHPVVALVHPSWFATPINHFVVVIGLDRARDRVFFHDPLTGAGVSLGEREFLAAWASPKAERPYTYVWARPAADARAIGEATINGALQAAPPPQAAPITAEAATGAPAVGAAVRVATAALVYCGWLRRAARARPPKQHRLRPADWSRRSLVADPRLDRIEWR